MGFAVRVRSAGQKYGPTCHQRDRADVTEFVTLVRLSSLGQHVGVLALAGYKRRKSAPTAGPIIFYGVVAALGRRRSSRLSDHSEGCSRNYPGGCKHFFVLWVEVVLLTKCPRGGGWGGNLSWGSRCI